MNRNNPRTVKIITRTVGQSFGTVGVLLDARTGRKVAVTDDVYPLGFDTSARAGAETLAAKRGWTVVS